MDTHSALLALGEGHPPMTSGFPSERDSDSISFFFSFFFNVSRNKLLAKQLSFQRFDTQKYLRAVTVTPIGIGVIVVELIGITYIVIL